MIQDNSSFRQRNVYKMIQHKLQSNYQRSNVIEQDIQNKDLKDQANIQSGQLILRQSRSQQLSTTPKTNSKSSNDKMPYIHFNTPQAIIKNKFKDKLFLSQKFSHDQGETNNYKKQLSIASSPIQKPLDLNSSQISNTNSAYYINQNLEQCFQKPQQGRLIYTSQNFVNFIKNKIRKSQPTHQKFSIYSEESSQLLEQSMYLLNMADSRILNLNQPYQVEIEETLQKSQQKNFYSPVLRENKKEQITLIENKFEFFKIDCQDKQFPLSIQVLKLNGQFKIYWSVSNPTPGTNLYQKKNFACIDVTKEQSWKIDLNQYQKETYQKPEFVYLGFISQNYNFIEIKFWFTDLNLQKYRKMKLSYDQIKISNPKVDAKYVQKRRENTEIDIVQQQEEIYQIYLKRREKLIQQSKFGDIINHNRKNVSEFSQEKRQKVLESQFQEKNQHIQEVNQKKQIIETQSVKKKVQSILQKTIERIMKQEIQNKELQKVLFKKQTIDWIQILSLIQLIDVIRKKIEQHKQMKYLVNKKSGIVNTFLQKYRMQKSVLYPLKSNSIEQLNN
ncbi:hypothetical protein TTHERM_00346910 (macronuclear) [Tetrahymena thermophila SB210]|uniref:Uncharacterized protein n=1 Tax=Tetrahymena thermophila (strain SB210) TaxID=312017 RepID=I7M214_TETTS|nr:hypothetical protein TTHERM_00346910 [Tetrahymena thermophila SB210]EAR98287.2 hypothetical protein TTHERM_00346910 [Tetrahymena thermophila SB210]|eukprot:XP_001018532.2 hypothetical protein TTHERM_00346910 [Tetrahymena thermophila SB210]